MQHSQSEGRPRIVLLGAGGVGKSALVLRFSEDRFQSDYDPTLEDLYPDKVHVVDGISIKLDILDTAGQEEYESMRRNWISQGDAFMVVYSVTEQVSFEEAELIFEEISGIKDTHDFPVVLVGNKIDLTKLIKVKSNDAHQLAKTWNAPHFQTSAKDNIEVDDAFHELVRELRRRTKKRSPDTKETTPKNHCCTIL